MFVPIQFLMNRLSILLLTGLLCLITNFGIAQGPTFSITPQSQSVTAGTTVSFTVNVTNFTNIEGFQFSMNWNPTELTYVSVSDYTLPGLTPGLFALNGNSKLGVSWTTPTGSAVSTANGLFYKVNFTAVKSGTAAMLFGTMPTPPEITGANGTDLTAQSAFSPALGTSGGGGGTTCAAPSVINVTPANNSASASWAAVTGANAYNVQYKTVAATTWTTATASTPSFTVPALVTCTDYEVKVQTVCATGTSTFSAATGFKTTGCSTGGGTGGTGGPCWTCNTANTLNGFGLIFSEEYTDVVGADVNVKLHVNQFTKMEGAQFEIRWDPTQLQYKGVNPTLSGLTSASFNTLNVTSGKLAVQWADITGTGTTITDCVSILDLQFKTLGAAGSTATVYINNTSSAIIPFEITALVNGASQQLNVPSGNLLAGKVILKKCLGTTPTPTSCVPTYTKTFNLAQTTVKSLEQTCVDIFVNDFTAIEGFQATIKWDPSILNFIAVKKTGLTDLVPGQYNVDATSGTMTISYNPTATSNVTLANGASAFQLCFTAAGNNGTSTDIKFATAPLNFEVYAAGVAKPGVTTQNGKVLIAEPPVVTIKELSPSCSGAKTGSMTAEVLPAGGNYTYAWAQSPNPTIIGTTVTITDLGVASYRVTVTDAKSCLTNVAVANLSNKAAPKITKIGNNVAGNGVIVEATFGKTYQWANSAGTIIGTDKELLNIPAGKYCVTVTSDAGCTAEACTVFLKVNVLTQNVKCGNDGKITLDPGAGNFTYAWSSNVSTTNIVSNIGVGNYKVTVTEVASNASATLDIPLNGPQILTLATITVDAGPIGCATASATGGTGTLSYKWSDGNNVTSAKNCGLSALSKYYVTITDQNGCAVTNFGKTPDEGVVLLCPALTLSDNNITVKNTTCGLNNGKINIKPIGGSGDFMVAWSPKGNNIVIDSLAAGTYNVTISDKQCPAQIKKNDIQVNASTVPVVELDQAVDAKDNCTGSITLKIKDGITPYSFVWTPNANGQIIKDPINLCEGFYKVTVTDAKGCVDTLSNAIKVTGTSVPLADDAATKITKTKCPNSTDGAINFVVKGGKAPFTYTWKLNGAVFPGTGSTLTNLAVGTYQVIATDAAGKTVTKDFILTSLSLLNYTVKVNDPKPNSAKNGSVSVQIIDGVAPYVYLWSNGEITPQINNLTTGTYSITITDGNGCISIKTFPVGDVGSVEIITRTNFNGVNIRCFGMCNGIAEVKNVPDAVAPLKYKWSTGDTSRIAKGLCVGTHKVIVTDALKQNFEGAINITGPDKLDLVLKTTDATNGLDGKAEINTLGGTAPFAYRWNNDGLSSIITNQVPGRVFVMVTDANGCDAFKEGVIGPRTTDVACMTAIPIITPNGDGYNDMFDIYCLDDYPKNKLDVFNRYGQLVFTKENYINRSWMPIDAKGNQLPEGGYFYVIETVHTDGSRPKTKGYFTILND
jgi:gliding motility-associated-like protein